MAPMGDARHSRRWTLIFPRHRSGLDLRGSRTATMDDPRDDDSEGRCDHIGTHTAGVLDLHIPLLRSGHHRGDRIDPSVQKQNTGIGTGRPQHHPVEREVDDRASGMDRDHGAVDFSVWLSDRGVHRLWSWIFSYYSAVTKREHIINKIIDRYLSPVWEVTNVFLVFFFVGLVGFFPETAYYYGTALLLPGGIALLLLAIRGSFYAFANYGARKSRLYLFLYGATGLFIPASLSTVLTISEGGSSAKKAMMSSFCRIGC